VACIIAQARAAEETAEILKSSYAGRRCDR